MVHFHTVSVRGMAGYRGGGEGECPIVSDKLAGGPDRPQITLFLRFVRSLSGYAFENNKSTIFSSSLLWFLYKPFKRNIVFD